MAYNSDGKHGTGDRYEDCSDARRGWRLQMAEEHPAEDEDRGQVLQDDGRGNAGALDGEIVEVIGAGNSQRAYDSAIANIDKPHAYSG